MTTWITETANLILIFLLGVYVIAAYASMWTRRYLAGFARCMAGSRYLLHGYGFLVLYLATQNTMILPFYLFQFAFFVLADTLQKRFFPNGIRMLYQHMMLLMGVGFLMLTRLSFEHAVKQFLMAVVALAVSMLIPWVMKKMPDLSKLAWLYVLLGISLLLVVLVTGSEIFGAKNWLTIKGITFQPSEFVKLLFVLCMAALLVRETPNKYRNLLLVSTIAAIHVGLLALSNDFGGALIFFVVYLLMLFVVSADLLFPIAAVFAGSAAALLAYRYSGHIKERVLAWQNPFSCIEDEGYQMAQSLFAIGGGEWLGTGLNEGMPGTVPIVKSDFIFSAIAEELGAVFSILLLLVYINCIVWMLALALERRQPFFFAVSTGAAALFGVQLFLNVGGVIKLIPSTGVTLAFISYGGSSLISTVFLFQGIQAMHGVEQVKTSKKKEKQEKGWTWQQFRMVLVCSALLVGLCVTTAFFAGATLPLAKESYNNDYNRRIKNLEKTMPKGKILASDGTILAQTVTGNGGELYRVYPHGKTTAFVTGQMLMGRTGLEESFRGEMYSVGLDFWTKLKKEVDGERLEGDSIVTTIDMELQNVAYEALQGYQGAIGVLEVKTGRILALASSPAYDPNEIEAAWEQLNISKNAPLLNRLTGGLYPPGSTFKLVTTLAYLRQHEEAEFLYECSGTARFQNTTVHCYNEKAHGKQTLKEAFANSCNTAYAYMGEMISMEDYQTVAEELGFGITWDGTIAYRADSFSLTEESDDAIAVQTAFGQGETLVTPFHNLMLAAAVANGGVLKLPYLVERTENCEGFPVNYYGSGEEIALLDPAMAELLTEYMVAASEDKTEEFTRAGIVVAGKTGSAEFAKDVPAHSWYICFAPADEPEIAVCVLLEQAGTGSSFALPAAKKVLAAYFGLE